MLNTFLITKMSTENVTRLAILALIFLGITGVQVRAADKPYMEKLSEDWEEVTQNFLKLYQINDLETKFQFQKPSVSKENIDLYLKQEFGAFYDGYHPLIEEYVRFFINKTTRQWQMWVTLDDWLLNGFGGNRTLMKIPLHLVRIQFNYSNFHNRLSDLLPYPISLIYGNKREEYLDRRWEAVNHLEMVQGYLKTLEKHFSSGSHQLASCVLGASTVTRIDSFQVKNYWQLYPHLNHESRDFYPAMLASAFVLHHFKFSGGKPFRYAERFSWVTVKSPYVLDLNLLSTALKDQSGLIQVKNKHLSDGLAFPNAPLTLTGAQALTFKKVELDVAIETARIYYKIPETNTLIVHHKKPDEDLNLLLKHYNVAPESFEAINQMENIGERNIYFLEVTRKDSAFYAGFDTLTMQQIEDQIEAKKVVNPNWPNEPEVKKPVASTRVIHRVKSGDTLSAISRKYGVSVSQIMRRNNLRSTTIRIGQKLIIEK